MKTTTQTQSTTLKVEIENKIGGMKPIVNILESVGFWNQEGVNVYNENKAGRMGSKFTQEKAQKLSAQEFILESLLNDCKAFTENHADFKYGKGGSHVWVSNKENKRILFVHF